MSNTVRILRSTTAGNTPSSLVSGQIAVNEADGRIYYRSAAGVVTQFSSIASYATAASFPASGASTSVLHLESDTSRLYQWTGTAYVEVGVSGGGAIHASTHATGGSDAITPASIGAAAASHVHSADAITSGTLADARLSATVTTALTNARTPTSHASSHASGGSDALTLAASQITGLPTAGTGSTNYCAGNDSRLSDSRTPTDGSVTTAKIADAAVTDAKISAVAASKLTGTVADARLSSNVATYATLAQAGNSSSSVIDIFPRGEQSVQGTAITSGTLWITFFTPQITLTVSAITMVSTQTAGASLTLARMGLYTFDETTATLVARCASDTTLFTSSLTAYTRSFATAGGFPSSYTLNAGTRYGVGVIVVGTTMPSLGLRPVNIALASLTPRMSGTLASQSDLPTTATITASQQSQPFARLS